MRILWIKNCNTNLTKIFIVWTLSLAFRHFYFWRVSEFESESKSEYVVCCRSGIARASRNSPLNWPWNRFLYIHRALGGGGLFTVRRQVTGDVWQVTACVICTQHKNHTCQADCGWQFFILIDFRTHHRDTHYRTSSNYPFLVSQFVGYSVQVSIDGSVYRDPGLLLTSIRYSGGIVTRFVCHNNRICAQFISVTNLWSIN